MSIKRWFNKGNMGEDQANGGWVRYEDVAPFLESQKPSTNTKSMPCLVGINGQPCRLGWPCKCQAPACLIARTAYVS